MQARDNPAALIQLAFPRVVFGPTHRYGTSANGLPPAIEAFTVADLQAFYRAHYRPDNATLLVVGDVTPAIGDADARKARSGRGNPTAWRRSSPRCRPRRNSSRAQIYIVDKPEAAQSQIRIGWVGVPRSTPDYAALEVLNTILGGSFTSRLNQNLREKNGYSYGASSAFDMRRSAGPFLAAAGVQTDKTGPARAEFFNELERDPETDLPPRSSQKAKNYVALGFPGEFETTGDLASQARGAGRLQPAGRHLLEVRRRR